MLGEDVLPVPDGRQRLRDGFYGALPTLLRAAGRGDMASLGAAIEEASRTVGPVSPDAANRMIRNALPSLMDDLERRIADARADVGNIDDGQ